MTHPHVRWRVMSILSGLIDLGSWIRHAVLTPEQRDLLVNLVDLGESLDDLVCDVHDPETAVGRVLFANEIALYEAVYSASLGLPSGPSGFLGASSLLSPEGERFLIEVSLLLARMVSNGLPGAEGRPLEHAEEVRFF